MVVEAKQPKPGAAREWLAQAFNRAEDVVYAGLGLLLAAIALSLLITEVFYFYEYLVARDLSENVVSLLDRILLIVIFVEVLYTVQVSFRQRVLQPEPFLVVGLIAVTRRILVLTAELQNLIKGNEATFRNAMLELGLLTVLIVALVVCLRVLRYRDQAMPAKD